MSIKRNILAAYVSQAYVTLIGIVMVPLYLMRMGAEAYALVGLFAMLQAWFSLLDMGLTPTMARETARFSGGATDALAYRRLVRALQCVFLAVAAAGGCAMFASAGYIASDWLNVQTLRLDEVRHALQVMAICVALRWMAGLYRGAVSGFERFVWLGSYDAAIATLRFVGVLPVLILVDATPVMFFNYQLLVAFAELAGLAIKVNHLLPSLPAGQRLGWSFAPIRPVLGFSLSIAATSSAWVLVTQTDKLVLSRLLPLADYGYFTLAVLVASGVMIATGPLAGALTARVARLQAQGDHRSVLRLYRAATQLACVIAFPAAFTIAGFAEALLSAWTGDPIAARNAAPILQLYALGNCVLAVSAFPYYLQYAKGDLRLHLLGSALFVAVLIPSIVWATRRYGGVGAGWAWLGSNVVYFLAWVPLVHSRLAPGLHWRWLAQDVTGMAVIAGLAGWALSAIVTPPESRMACLLFVLSMTLVVSMITALGSSTCRNYRLSWA
jgi:O-antigen/teichoic acid export membrane protein